MDYKAERLTNFLSSYYKYLQDGWTVTTPSFYQDFSFGRHICGVEFYASKPEYWAQRTYISEKAGENMHNLESLLYEFQSYKSIIEFNKVKNEYRQKEIDQIVQNEIKELRRIELDTINKVQHQEMIKRISRKPKTYIMKDAATGLYKIGKSINPQHREKTLQSEKPTVKMVWNTNKDIEEKLHKKYASQRVRGEWFSLTPVQVKYICTHY